MKKKCLLLETKDKLKLFTYTKYYKELIEFSKKFEVTLSIVKVENPAILSLNQIAPILCSPDNQPEFRGRKKIKVQENVAQRIRSYIKETFLKKEVVKLQIISQKFKQYGYSIACHCQHIKHIREQLTKEGHIIKKVGGGKYQLV